MTETGYKDGLVCHKLANPLRYSASLVLLLMDEERGCFTLKTTMISFRLTLFLLHHK